MYIRRRNNPTMSNNKNRTLDQAIEYAKELSYIYEECGDLTTADNQMQIADWLIELKRWRALSDLRSQNKFK